VAFLGRAGRINGAPQTLASYYFLPLLSLNWKPEEKGPRREGSLWDCRTKETVGLKGQTKNTRPKHFAYCTIYSLWFSPSK
jgi:hypothetical protein